MSHSDEKEVVASPLGQQGQEEAENTNAPSDNHKEITQNDRINDDDDDDDSTSISTSSSEHVSPTRQRSQGIMSTDDQAELVRVATALDRRRSSVAVPTHITNIQTGEEEYTAAVDPTKPEFDLHIWLRRFVKQLREQGMTSRSTGVAWRDLNVYGSGSALRLQSTVSSVLSTPLRLGELLSLGKKPKKHILRQFDGMIGEGEMLIVLGRPGSGCSTFLKTLCGELNGLQIGERSTIHYSGIPLKKMQEEFKGEAIYNQEVDRHFPHLTVGQTLEFAASVRTPSHRIQGLGRKEFTQYIAQVVMAAFGLSHTYNTKVGNDFIRGVSGGERKRVSIAEMMLSGAPFAAWDNSTRGLDSATAFEFCRALRLGADLGTHTYAVAIYQASQAIYDIFDKAIVLYEGREIYFGSASHAKRYFEKQGWFCPARQTTGDFLTSLTNPAERQAKTGFEAKVPRTPDEFEQCWRSSPEFEALQRDLNAYEQSYAGERQDQSLQRFREEKVYRQAKHVRPGSPYMVSIPMQIRLNTKRAYQRLWGDKSATVASCVLHIVLALVIGSIFFGTPLATISFYSKGSVLFMAILLNALTAIAEVNALYAQRPIVTKHASYGFYHPWTEAAAGVVADIPVKFLIATCFNIVLYFLANLRREPSQFFIYFLINYISIFIMSGVFRTMAASTKTVSQAMTGAGVLVLALVIYTGFTITVPDMHPWFSWIRWINPIFYAFEILISNEFHGRNFTCSSIVPPYSPPRGDFWVCPVVGAIPGQDVVLGDRFISENYKYSYSHVWRNFGILIAFLIFFMAMYFIVTEFNSKSSSTAEALVFQRGRVPKSVLNSDKGPRNDAESASGSMPSDAAVVAKDRANESNNSSDVKLAPQRDIFTWRDVVYDIHIKGEPRRLLDHVAGWVKPGTLTALMGVSGAGKTTLLDVLAQRTTMGVVTGDMFVSGKPLDPSFQRNTGYVQQQDLHLETSTVRESLRFSAMLRQPSSVSKKEKEAFVEDVIKMLNMEDFADAVVGVPGEGLNVEQRKLLTIGVELAARPKLLLFLDEPTSGLDSQSSWAICAFLRKLADSGQAILCTIHQPSAILFQTFDRLLFLAKGGKTVYFGDIGHNSRTLLDYFERNGARACGDHENPAEFMLEVVNHGTNNRGEAWFDVWRNSPEQQAVNTEIDYIHEQQQNREPSSSPETHSEFAMPLITQVAIATHRSFQQYWRTPSYIFAKFLLGVAAGLFIGFTFYHVGTSQAGTQNAIFAVFLLTTIFTTIVQQIQPLFITQRSLYEVRERPSKAYSWKAFLLANIIVEIPYQIITGIIIFACFYYPTFGIQSSQQQGIVLLFTVQLFIYASAFAHMTIAALPDAQTAANLVTLLSLMSVIFSGVLQTPDALPGFWKFMWRLSPFNYWIGGIIGTVLHDREINCASRELSVFSPPPGSTCGEYLAAFIQGGAPGRLLNPSATADCEYCSLTTADQYLANSRISYDQRWRNFGILWAYIVFNIAVAVLTYYMFRVRTWNIAAPKLPKLRLPWSRHGGKNP